MASHVEASRLDFSSIGRRVAVRISARSASDEIIGGAMCLRRIVGWNKQDRTITVMNCDDLAGTEATVSEEFVFWWGAEVARKQQKYRKPGASSVERMIDGIVDDALGMGDPQ